MNVEACIKVLEEIIEDENRITADWQLANRDTIPSREETIAHEELRRQNKNRRIEILNQLRRAIDEELSEEDA